MDITFPVSDSEHAALVFQAAAQGCTVGDLVRATLKNYVEAWSAAKADADKAKIVDAFLAADDTATKAEIIASVEGE